VGLGVGAERGARDRQAGGVAQASTQSRQETDFAPQEIVSRVADQNLICCCVTSVTFMVVSQFFWLLAYVPFVPATPVQLMLAIWILIPQNEGEKVMYLVFSDYFMKFETKMTSIGGFFFTSTLNVVLKFAVIVTDYCARRTLPQKLIELQLLTEHMDEILLKQIKLRGAIDKSVPRQEKDGVSVQPKRSYAQEMAARKSKVNKSFKDRTSVTATSEDDF